MKDMIRRFEALLVSITFAEAGEHDTSQQILADDIHEAHDAEACLTV